MKKIFVHLTHIAALAAVYYLAGKLGLSLAFINKSATAVWPPSGIALAAVILWGYKVWPGIFLGAFFVNLTTAGNVATSFSIALGNTLEPVVGAFLVARFCGGRNVFNRAQDIFKFVFFAAMPSTMISATWGLTSLCLGGFAPWANYPQIWFTWWLGDLVSDLGAASFLLIWTQQPVPHITIRKALEAALLVLCVFVVCQAVFGGWIPSEQINQPLKYLTIPFVLWAAFRFGRRGTVTICLITSALVLLGTLRRFGLYSIVEPNVELILLQVFMATITTMGLVLAAVVVEEKQSFRALVETNEKLQEEVFERKKAQSALDVHTQRLTQMNAELEQFAYIASHDLQEPLRKIISFGDRLVEGSHLSDEERDYCERMQKAGYRMRKIIEDLLRFSHLSSSKAVYEKVDLKAVFDNVLSDLEMAIEESGTEIQIGELPVVFGNSSQLQHVFQNLIMNAIKFRSHEFKPVIRITGVVKNNMASISVKDNGIGFNPLYIGKIFNPFQRLHGREYEGTGMGLAICRKIVESHHGTVSAASEVRKGSTFTVVLPLAGT